MTAHMKKAHLKMAIVGVIEPISRIHAFDYEVNISVEHYPGVVELTVLAALQDYEVKGINKALDLIMTDGAITFRDDNGFC